MRKIGFALSPGHVHAVRKPVVDRAAAKRTTQKKTGKAVDVPSLVHVPANRRVGRLEVDAFLHDASPGFVDGDVVAKGSQQTVEDARPCAVRQRSWGTQRSWSDFEGSRERRTVLGCDAPRRVALAIAIHASIDTVPKIMCRSAPFSEQIRVRRWRWNLRFGGGAGSATCQRGQDPNESREPQKSARRSSPHLRL